MTRTDHLLWVLAEECAEVAQRASKAARFGLGEIEPGQNQTNARRIAAEMADLIGTYEKMMNEGLLPQLDTHEIDAKQERIERFLVYSRTMGRLEEKS